MKRAAVILLLVVFVVVNVAIGYSFRQRLVRQVSEAEKALEDSPQEQLLEKQAELEQLDEAVRNWRRRVEFTLADAIGILGPTGVVWEAMSLSSSEESRNTLDVLIVRGLAGSVEQLSRVDRRLGRQCTNFRRTPTRDGKNIVTCTLRTE